MKVKECPSCNQIIKFIETTKGKLMPVDPYLTHIVQTGERRGEGIAKIITPEGEIRFGRTRLIPNESTISGFRTHWETCKEPDKYRKS